MSEVDESGSRESIDVVGSGETRIAEDLHG
jgi:hypothetical protein